MDIMETVADLMEISARTAPKTCGQDYVESKVITGDTLNNLAEEMADYGSKTGAASFNRDANNISNSCAVLLLSVKQPEEPGLNCGACGYENCAHFSKIPKNKGPQFDGPICAWRLVDLGIALGSAAKTAGLLNTDNRVMYSVGVVAKKMNLIEGNIVVGIPISVTGKSIYFDRKK